MACTGSLTVFLKLLNSESHGNWIDEETLVEKIASQVVEFLKREKFIDENQSFKDLKIIDLLEDDIVREVINTKDLTDKIGLNILLIKKLIHNNDIEIDRLLRLTKTYGLNSNSSFISSIVSVKNNEELSINDFVRYFLKKYIIIRHQWVSLKKMNNTQSTEKFIREDGLIRFIDDVDYAYSSPRLNTLIDFLTELQLINNEKNDLTTIGLELFNTL